MRTTASAVSPRQRVHESVEAGRPGPDQAANGCESETATLRNSPQDEWRVNPDRSVAPLVSHILLAERPARLESCTATTWFPLGHVWASNRFKAIMDP